MKTVRRGGEPKRIRGTHNLDFFDADAPRKEKMQPRKMRNTDKNER